MSGRAVNSAGILMLEHE